MSAAVCLCGVAVCRLVKYVPLAEMQDRGVVVLCNLK